MGAALTVSINGDNSQLQKALQGAERAITSWSKKTMGGMEAVLKGGLAAAGVIKLIDAATSAIKSPFEGIKGQFEKGAELEVLHQRTGASIKDLIALAKAFKESDISADQLGPTINKLQAALGGLNEQGEDTKGIFSQLGLSADELKKLSPTQQILAIGDAINSLADATERAYAARKIFGKGGGEMLQLFNNRKAMDDARSGGGTYADIMARNAEVFHRIEYLLSAAIGKLKQFWAGIAEAVAPTLLPLLEQFNRLDFAKWGAQAGRAVAIVTQAFKEGQISELFGLSLKIGAMEGVNFLDHAFRGLISLVSEMFSQSVEMMGEDFKLLMSSQFWKGLGSVLAGAAMKFGTYMADALRRPIVLLRSGIEWAIQQALSKIPGIGKLLGGDFSHPESFDKIFTREDVNFKATNAKEKARGNELLDSGGTDLVPLIQERLKRVQDRLANLGKSFGEGFSGSSDLFDLKGEESKLKSMLAQLASHVAKAASDDSNNLTGDSLLDQNSEKRGSGGKSTVVTSALQRVGGGGGHAGGASALVGLHQETNRLLQDIKRGLTTNRLDTGSGLPKTNHWRATFHEFQPAH